MSRPSVALPSTAAGWRLPLQGWTQTRLGKRISRNMDNARPSSLVHARNRHSTCSPRPSFLLINRLCCDQRSAGRLSRWLVVRIMTIALDKGKFAARRVRKTAPPKRRQPGRRGGTASEAIHPSSAGPQTASSETATGERLLHRLLASRLPRRDTADVLKVSISCVAGLGEIRRTPR